MFKPRFLLEPVLCFDKNIVVKIRFVQPVVLARSGGSRTFYEPSPNSFCQGMGVPNWLVKQD